MLEVLEVLATTTVHKPIGKARISRIVEQILLTMVEGDDSMRGNTYERRDMDFSDCLETARKMAANAKDGTLNVGGETYTLTFDHRQWLYIVQDANGNTLTNFNTKSLQQARKWLREWLAN